MVLRDSVSDCLDALDNVIDLGANTWASPLPPALRLLEPRPRRRQRPHVDGYVSLPDGEARYDAYPEGSEYHDEGCELAPACLSCPFPDCRFDLPRGFLTMRTSTNMERSQALRAQGLTVDAVAGQLGVSRRTVQRWSAVTKAGA